MKINSFTNNENKQTIIQNITYDHSTINNNIENIENKIQNKIENKIEIKPIFNFNLPGKETIELKELILKRID